MRELQIILVLILNNIGEWEIYDGGMGVYYKEVPCKTKKKIKEKFTQCPLSRSPSYSFIMIKLKKISL